jgi:hypothetical protein
MFRPLLSVFLGVLVFASYAMAQDSKVYELRTYSVEPSRQADTLKLMSAHGAGFMKKYGIEMVGVWTPIDSTDERVLMLASHKDYDTAKSAWASFQADADWKTAVKNSEVEGKKPVKGIEQVFLTANDYSPKLEVASVGNRVFELRTYVSTPNNLQALNNRFKNHTLALFEKHGMKNIVYWSVRNGETLTCQQMLNALSPAGKAEAKVEANTVAAGNSLVYFLTHASSDAAKESFGKFRDDSNWQKALKESEAAAGGALTVSGGVKSLFLKPADFSPLK